MATEGAPATDKSALRWKARVRDAFRAVSVMTLGQKENDATPTKVRGPPIRVKNV